MRFQLCNDYHIKNVKTGQHNAREERTRIQLHHRHACRCAIHNEHDRWGNQNAQATASRNGTRRKLHAVPGPQHGWQCQQTHERDHSAHNAGGRGKNSTGNDGGNRQRTRHPRSGQVHAFKELLNQVGTLNEVAHEHKQRNGDEHIVGHDRVSALHHQIKRLVDRQTWVLTSVSNPREDHAHAHEGERRWKTQHDGNHHQGEHQQAQMTIAHFTKRGKQYECSDDHQGHDGEPKPNFFFHF